MKRKGRHPERALTAVQVRTVKEAGRYADGNGLYLIVDPSGARRWLLRVVAQGRRQDLGLGSVQLVTLSEAREKAVRLRGVARDGGDPLAEIRKTKQTTPTFREAAERVHAERKAGWRNGKHVDQWINTLVQHGYPVLEKKRVDQITSADVLKVLSPIWLKTPETARRVRQRLKVVLDWAKVAGFRSGDNPVDHVDQALPKHSQESEHHTAMPYAAVPPFLRRLRSSNFAEGTRLAFEFLILTAARTSEVLKATWAEVDLTDAVWTIPASRMKAKRQHRVPLSDRCVSILQRAKELSGDSVYIFPGHKEGRPLSNMVFLEALRRMAVPVTAHGFRSSFRDWASEQTNYPREVCEAAMAHVVRDKVEAAYRRSDLFERRRSLMQDWTSFVQS